MEPQFLCGGIFESVTSAFADYFLLAFLTNKILQKIAILETSVLTAVAVELVCLSLLISSAPIIQQVKLRSSQESVGYVIGPGSQRIVKINYVNREPSTVVQSSNEFRK